MRLFLILLFFFSIQMTFSQIVSLHSSIPAEYQLLIDPPLLSGNNSSARQPDLDSLLKFSFNYLGTPYRYGGKTANGFDCSGFVSYVFGHFGVQLPHSSREQQNFGFELPIDSVQKGDLLFFKGRNLQSNQTGHVSIVVDVSPERGIEIIHSTKAGLRLDWLSQATYFKRRFIGARRIINQPQRLVYNH